MNKNKHLKNIFKYQLLFIITILFCSIFYSNKVHAVEYFDPQKIFIMAEQSINLPIRRDAKLYIEKAEVFAGTNSEHGYDLYISAENESISSGSNKPNNTVYSASGSFESPAPLIIDDANGIFAMWGFAVPSLDQFNKNYNIENPSLELKFAPLETLDATSSGLTEQLIHSHTGSADYNMTTVYYGTISNENLEEGFYENTVIYTAILKTSAEGNLLRNAELEVNLSADKVVGGFYNNIELTATAKDLYIPSDSNLINANSVSVLIDGRKCSDLKITNYEPVTVVCKIPDNLNPGKYNVELNMPDLGKNYNKKDAIIIDEPNVYAVFYEANGEDVTNIPDRESVSVLEDSYEFALSSVVPAREKHIFVGWSTDANTLTPEYLYDQTTNTFSDTIILLTESNKTKTLYAIWLEIIDYSLIYNANNGTNAPASDAFQTTDASHDFTINTTIPSRANHKFLGYAESADADTPNYIYADNRFEPGSVTLTKDAREKTLYAVWIKINNYKLNYNANSGTNAPASDAFQTTDASHEFSINSTTIPSRVGYKFLGYSETADATAPDYVFNNNSFNPNKITVNKNTPEKTLYAVWLKINNYKLIYNSTNGTNIPSQETFETTDASHEFSINNTTIPSRSGHKFLGYANSNTSTIADYTYNDGSFSPSTITLSQDAPEKTIYAVWEFNTINMQNMNSSTCQELILNQEYTLTDSRDGKTYTIARLKMNSAGTETACWMTQNLDLNLNSGTALTNANTDLNTIASWTPSNSTVNNIANWIDVLDAPVSFDNGDVYHLPDATYNSLSACTSAGHSEIECRHYHIGNHYNYLAAIASNDALSTTSGSAPNSICPKGWRLWIASSSNNEMSKLLSANGVTSGSIAKTAPLYFTLSGLKTNTSGDLRSQYGFYTSATTIDMANHYYLSFSSDIMTSESLYGRKTGFPIRCIAR